MQKKLIWIFNEDFDATVELPIIHSAFVKTSRKNENTINQCMNDV